MEEKKLGEMTYEEAMKAISEKIDYIETDEAKAAAIGAFIFICLQL